MPLGPPRVLARTTRAARAGLSRGLPEGGGGAGGAPGRRIRLRLLIGALAVAAAVLGVVAFAMADHQKRGDLLPPSIATDNRGLSTVAWTEIARPGIRVAQERRPGHWSTPQLLDPNGGPGASASAEIASPTSPTPIHAGWW